MLHVHLTEDERRAVQALRCDRSRTPAERDRVEIVLLSDAGWGAPRIAAHVGCHAALARLPFSPAQSVP